MCVCVCVCLSLFLSLSLSLSLSVCVCKDTRGRASGRVPDLQHPSPVLCIVEESLDEGLGILVTALAGAVYQERQYRMLEGEAPELGMQLFFRRFLTQILKRQMP